MEAKLHLVVEFASLLGLQCMQWDRFSGGKNVYTFLWMQVYIITYVCERVFCRVSSVTEVVKYACSLFYWHWQFEHGIQHLGASQVAQ